MILCRVPGVECEEYILIGESYIHGMMDREAMEKLDRSEYELKKLPSCNVWGVELRNLTL